MLFELLQTSDDSTTAPTITSAPDSSASSSSRSGKKRGGGKGTSVKAPSSGFYPRTKGKKSKKTKKSKGAFKSKIKNSKKSKSKKVEESVTPTSPGKYLLIEYLFSNLPYLMLAALIVLSSFCF